MTNARPGPADIAMSPAVRSEAAKLTISGWKDASSEYRSYQRRGSRQRKIVPSCYSDESRR
ncbi:hypothetical protein M405DRAFT_810789 [Rhizopogon salebrosus TDB-379]|nr:hypothetical protein M405DRAFT_810789 [Rhizopogon salebrosus TDB-379]